jgi:hypothetical protein
MVHFMLPRITINSLQSNNGLYSHQQTNLHTAKDPISQCSKKTGLPPIFTGYGVQIQNIKLSWKERYKQSINITASQHNITANDIPVKYSDKLIWLIMCYNLQNLICYKYQNQGSCCCEPISYSNNTHVSYLILHSGKTVCRSTHLNHTNSKVW